ncbi:MAG: AAA family ATPase [Gemmatimonadetes bacterium]|nr:AAA family ATPase [Gemmatimonadota bacterium]
MTSTRLADAISTADDGHLTLRLLGEPYLARRTPTGDEVRVLGKGKPLALIAYLSVIAQHEASREFLMDLLWGGNCVRDPAHSLRNVLLQIRNAGLDELLDATMSRCRLTRPLPSDLTALTVALQENRPADAIALFTGDFFADFAAPGCHEFELWADSVRHRVRSDVANALDVHVRRLLDSGRPRDAANAARSLVQIEPHGQRSRRALIEALLAAGEFGQALTETAVLAQWLSAEELDPEPATVALIAQARRERAATGVPPVAATDELRPDLIGREAEFAAIIAAWEAARQATTGFVGITAGAGIGKSRLLADIEQRLRSLRVRTVRIRALPGERDVPFALISALVTKLAALSGAAAVTPGTAGVLIGLNSALASVFNAPSDTSGLDLLLRRSRALHELLLCIADEKPTALLLDDLHWADDASVDALQAAFARLSVARVLVVVAERPGARIALPADRTVALVLAPLTEAQVDALVGSIRPLPDVAWRGEVIGALHAASRGIPLFVLLALRDVLQAGLLRAGADEWTCNDPPALIRHLTDGNAMSRSLGALSPLALRFVASLALAGRALPARLLAAAADGTEAPAIHEALVEAERHALIVRDGDRYALAHDLIADAVLGLITLDDRTEWTRELGFACVRDSDARWLARGARLLASVVSPFELASALAPALQRTALPRNRTVATTLATWLGPSSEHRDLARAVARALPSRIRLRPFRRRLTFSVVGLVLMGTATAWRINHSPEPPDAVLRVFGRDAANHSTEWRLNIRGADWDPAHPLELRRGRPYFDSTRWLSSHSGANVDPRNGTMLEERVFNDSGASEVTAVAEDGGVQRLTHSTGDDVPGSWSPDMRAVTFASSRWSAERHHAIAVLDLSSGLVRRVTRNLDRETAPQWSPDGSRLAFLRQPLDGRPRQLCVIDIDGERERCTNLSRTEAPDILGWSSASTLMVTIGAFDRTSRLVAFSPDSTWRRDTLATALGSATISPFGDWVAWQESAAGDGLVRVAPLQRMERSRTLEVPSSGRVFRTLTWGATGHPRPFVDSLVFARSVDTLYVGVPHHLEVLAAWSDGRRSTAPNAHWHSRDAAIQTDSLNVLIARIPGRFTVQATTGGWRTASHVLVVLPRREQVVLDERWADLARWRVFGDPTPRIVADKQRGPAFSNEGDGSYFSGAYLRRSFAFHRGLALDATVRTPVNELQWQLLATELRVAEPEHMLARWDHRTGYLPFTGKVKGLQSCLLIYPYTEGVEGRQGLQIGDAIVRLDAATQRWLVSGTPYSVRLQILPDGRCGAAINGVPIGLSGASIGRGSVLTPLTYGSTWRTKLLLGPLRVIDGVPSDIDWSRFRSPTVLHLPPPRTTPRSPK